MVFMTVRYRLVTIRGDLRGILATDRMFDISLSISRNDLSCLNCQIHCQTHLADRQNRYGRQIRRMFAIREMGLVRMGGDIYNSNTSGRGAVWLARLNGVQEVAGSNPVAPTFATR